MRELPDFQRAGNQAGDPDTYEIENAAIDPDGTPTRLCARRRPGPAEPFPAERADEWLRRHPGATGLTYGYVLFIVRR